MDKTARDVLAIALRRLRQLEKDRLEDRAIMDALAFVVRSAGPKTQDLYREKLAEVKQNLAKDPAASLDPIYDGLIELLENRDPLEKDEQERLRGLREAYKGPLQ